MIFIHIQIAQTAQWGNEEKESSRLLVAAALQLKFAPANERQFLITSQRREMRSGILCAE